MSRLSLAGEVPLYRGDMEADLLTVSRNRLVETITGGLSAPSRMQAPDTLRTSDKTLFIVWLIPLCGLASLHTAN